LFFLADRQRKIQVKNKTVLINALKRLKISHLKTLIIPAAIPIIALCQPRELFDALNGIAWPWPAVSVSMIKPDKTI
jgi:hypothetical protein